jgi:hypothetical protein
LAPSRLLLATEEPLTHVVEQGRHRRRRTTGPVLRRVWLVLLLLLLIHLRLSIGVRRWVILRLWAMRSWRPICRPLLWIGLSLRGIAIALLGRDTDHQPDGHDHRDDRDNNDLIASHHVVFSAA